MKKYFVHTFSFIGILVLKALSILPMAVLYVIADGFYLLLYKTFGYRKKVVKDNLKQSFPEKSESELLAIEKKFYHYLSDLIVETVKGFSIGKKEVTKRMQFINRQVLDELVVNNQSAIMVMGHYGNWEWLCRASQMLADNQMIVAYKPLSNSLFNDLMQKARTKFGVMSVPMMQLPRVLKEQKKPYLLILLADQSPSDRNGNIWVPFLNRETAVMPGIEKLALKYKLPVYYNTIRLLKRGYYTCEFKLLCRENENTNEGDITKLHTMALEKNIIEKPELWLWSHKRWKHKKQ
ncbi:MAG: lysophospholipid acyltransferase family protein [Bacteroidota bacterium]